MMRPCYSLDWLSYSALLPRPVSGADFVDDAVRRRRGYVVHPSTRIYSDVVSIYKTPNCDSKLYTICANPRTPILPPSIVHVQLSNLMCYADYISAALAIARHWRAYDLRVSRVDVACDFEQVEEFGDPADFIRAFVSGDVLLRRFSKWQVYGSGDDKRNDVTGFAWGSRSSSVYSRLYNKRREMSDTRQSKPYIFERWIRHGWKGDSDVWRLEFECKRLRAMQGETYINGDLYQWQPSDLEERWHGLYQKYGNFVRPTATRKTRCKPYWPIEPNALFPIVEPVVGDCDDTKRLLHKDADRLINALDKYTNSHRIGSDDLRDDIAALSFALRKKFWTAPQL